MSPRSEEFMAGARERLSGARDALAAGHPDLAASAAYYAMLYAARAALSERDVSAKTHAGVWSAFGSEIVVGAGFDADLARDARRAQRVRELGDYEAQSPSEGEAAEILAAATRFLDEIDRLI